MGLVQWNAEMSVGVARLDQQHQQLVKMVNELHDAMARGQGKNVVNPMLNKLIQYTQTHFADEEKYMREANYADFDVHKQEHEKLTQQVRELKARLDNGQTSLTIDIMNFLASWLKNHILGTDKKYAPALAGQR